MLHPETSEEFDAVLVLCAFFTSHTSLARSSCYRTPFLEHVRPCMREKKAGRCVYNSLDGQVMFSFSPQIITLS